MERPKNAPEGNAWRNTFDLYAQWDTIDWLSLLAQLDAGFEPNDFGTSSWYAGAALRPGASPSWLFATVRGDRFWEHVPSNGLGAPASPIFWGGAYWVSELTATVEIKPPGSLASFVEYRHDQAESPIYFRGGRSWLRERRSPRSSPTARPKTRSPSARRRGSDGSRLRGFCIPPGSVSRYRGRAGSPRACALSCAMKTRRIVGVIGVGGPHTSFRS